MIDDLEIRGGQLWEQPNFPYCRRYVTLLGDGRMALLSTPDRHGSLAATGPDGKWSYTPEEAEAHLRSLDYINQGDWSELQAAKWDRILERVRLESPALVPKT